jgi:tetratricopeptide (TPR) repeat protein
MNKKSKSALFITGLAIGLVIFFFVAKSFITSPISREIPKIQDTSNLSKPVQDQISMAYKTAYRKPSAENLGMLGMVYYSSANYTEAAKCYELAIQKNKTAFIWKYYYGYLQLELGNPDSAIVSFRHVTEINPEIHLAWYYLGNAAKNLKKYDLAEDAFQKAASITNRTTSTNTLIHSEHFPLSAYASFELARINLDIGKTEVAEKMLSELVISNPLFGPAYKMLGTIYNLKGNSELGDQYTVRSNDFIDFSPPVDTLMDRIVLLSRSELYLLKKIDEAEKSFHSDWALKLVTQGLQFMPDNSYLISKAIKIYLWKNLNDQAIALTDKHLKLFWDNFAEIKNTGMFFFQKGIYQQAAKYWTRALELKPGETLISEYLAKCLWATGDKQKSQEILNEIIEQNPDNTDVIADVTALLIQFGAREKAIENLGKMKKLDPSNPKVQKISGEIAQANGETQKAISFYESAFKGNAEDVETIKKLGELYYKQQMWNKYISLFRKALQFHPNNVDFLARLGEILISCPEPSLQNIEEGRYYAERAFTYYNCPPEVLIAAGSHLAYAYSLLGDQQKAITTISQTINIGRRQKIPASQQAKLEDMLTAFRNMSN